jgi:hypothetical protein
MSRSAPQFQGFWAIAWLAGAVCWRYGRSPVGAAGDEERTASDQLKPEVRFVLTACRVSRLTFGGQTRLTWVGDSGIEPVTSTVSRCRATALTIELPPSSWASAVGGSLDFPTLTPVSPPSVGALWGQPWGQPQTAI